MLTYDEIFPYEFTEQQLITYAGRKCFARKSDDGSYILEQLISTDPNDFLLPHFTPGTIMYHASTRPVQTNEY